MKKYPFDRILSATATLGVNDLFTESLRPGWLYCFQRVAVENETSDCTAFRILKRGPGGEFLIYERKIPAAATLYTYDEPFYAVPGQQVGVRFVDAVEGDRLRVYLAGWMAPGDWEVGDA
jgi:hypothetical protein